jgi:small conductance mechanosensitive channel
MQALPRPGAWKLKENGYRMPLEEALKGYILPIGLAFAIAYLVHRVSGFLVGPVVRLTGLAPGSLRLRQGRQRTIYGLLSSTISFVAFVVAIVFALGFFVDRNTLVWMLGLFSAAFGLGARPLIADWLTGVGFLFGNTFDVGDKVEILGVEGVIEKIDLRTTFMRAPSGELYIIPNGEIRVIRNFSRGQFSLARIKIKVSSEDLEPAIVLLQALGKEAVTLQPDLLEPWQVLSSGEFGQYVELTLLAKVRFGQAADLQPHLLSLVHKHLEEASIHLTS